MRFQAVLAERERLVFVNVDLEGILCGQPAPAEEQLQQTREYLCR
jgi:hypothetical protein